MSGLHAWTDGACSGNPGPGGWGVVLRATGPEGAVRRERELMTKDAEAAKKFYGATLGWTFESMDQGDGAIYWIAKVGEEAVAGIFTIPADDDETGEGWFAYIAVNDLSTALARATSEGGEVLREPWDVPGVGRMVVVRVLAADGTEHAEVRGSMRLPECEVLARRRLLRLLSGLGDLLAGTQVVRDLSAAPAPAGRPGTARSPRARSRTAVAPRPR